MMKINMPSSQHAVGKKEDRYADQGSKLCAVQVNVTMVLPLKISAEDRELKSLHPSNAENDFL